MALHAKIVNGLVDSIVDILDEDQYQELAQTCSTLIDISNITPAPQVGWLHSGPLFVAPEQSPEDVQANLATNVTGPAIEYGIKLKKDVAAKIGAKNLMLEKTPQEISSLVSTLISIGFLLEGGALVTASGALQASMPNFPEYEAEFLYAINKINEFVS